MRPASAVRNVDCLVPDASVIHPSLKAEREHSTLDLRGECGSEGAHVLVPVLAQPRDDLIGGRLQMTLHFVSVGWLG